MALKIADRVRETTTTEGTGTISLGGAVGNFETFSANLSNKPFLLLITLKFIFLFKILSIISPNFL